jgi:Terminase RNaseH-like domain
MSMPAIVESPAVTVRLKHPHAEQLRFLRSHSPRRVIRAGRRSGKTTGLAIFAVEEFIKGERVLYSVPTSEQVGRFWHEVSMALAEPIDAGIFRKNETTHIIERPGTEQRIRAKTAWSADTLRGDYSTRLILDEWQLCNEDAWALVGAPMMLDKAGSIAIFCYTPPSIRSAGVTKAHNPRHAADLFKAASLDTTGRWATFHFSSHANPFISRQALDEITQDMSVLAHRQEIMAEDIDDIPGALWTQSLLDKTRVKDMQVPALVRIVVALDPAATSADTADEMGIIVAGVGTDGHGYTLRDASMRGTPAACAKAAISVYDTTQADALIAEVNNGGEWIETVVRFVASEMHRQGERPSPAVHYKMVHASRNKQTRAEPIAAEYEHGRVHHVGAFPALESEMAGWVPGMPSPSRMDAAVWAFTELMLHAPKKVGMMTLRY